LAVEPVGG